MESFARSNNVRYLARVVLQAETPVPNGFPCTKRCKWTPVYSCGVCGGLPSPCISVEVER